MGGAERSPGHGRGGEESRARECPGFAGGGGCGKRVDGLWGEELKRPDSRVPGTGVPGL